MIPAVDPVREGSDGDVVDGRFAGRIAFQDRLRSLLDEAARCGWSELFWIDADFADWPLGEPDVLASLTAWVRPHRRLTLLACGYDTLARRHPRWVAWHRVWSHAVVCRQIEPDIAASDVPTYFIVPAVRMLHLLDQVHWRGTVSAARTGIARAMGEFDAISQRSTEAFGPTTLGL